MNKYYVYAHYNPIKKEIFYIGKGKGTRAKHVRRNRFWKFIVDKYGFEVQIIKDNLSEQESFNLEIELIKTIGRRDLGTGTLVNLTNGGEGSSGYNHTEYSRKKMSISRSGRGNHMYGKVSPRKGIKESDEQCRNKSLRLLGSKNPAARTLLQFALDGKFIKEYSTVAEAKLITGLNNLSKAARNNKPKHNYIWKYKHEKVGK